MPTMTLDTTARWSYNGYGTDKEIAIFRNPSNSLKATVNSLSVYLGTVVGTCTAGEVASGDGSPFYTWITISGKKSNENYIANRVGITSFGSSGTYPIRSQTIMYTFTFKDNEVIIPPGGSASVLIRCPSTSDVKVLAMNANSQKDNGKSIVIEYKNIEDKKPTPENVSIKLQDATSYTATSIDFVVTSASSATNCNVILDGKTIVSNASMSNNRYYGRCSVTRTTNVNSGTHKLETQCRNGNSDWSGWVSCGVDCTVPSFIGNEPSIIVTSQTSGTLQFKSNYDVNFTIGTTAGTAYKDTNYSGPITLSSNSIKNYALEIKRKDNVKITNSATISGVDTTPPKITLTYELYGTTCYITAVADSECENWSYTCYERGSSSKIPVNIAGRGKTITATIKNLDPYTDGKVYEIYVQATKTANKIQGKSNYVYPEVIGGARIYDENEPGSIEDKYKSASIYIWLDGTWRSCMPYIYDNGKWKLGL